MPEDLETILALDPLGEAARKERKALLVTSLIALAMATAGLVPSEINFLGIKMSLIKQPAIFWLIVAVVIYFLISFVVYAIPDFFKWWTRYRKWQFELEKESWEWELKHGPYDSEAESLREPLPPKSFNESFRKYSESDKKSRQLTFARVFIFDLSIPLLVGCTALFFAIEAALG